MVNKMQPVPLYHQVKEDILNKINKNIFQVGEIIPSEAELQSTYDVSRITIRRAIQQLVQEGYLSPQQGKGTYVRQTKATQELNVISTWAETMKSLNMHPETKSISISEEIPSGAVERMLNLQPGQKIYKIERLRHAAYEPICIMINYLIPETVPGLLEKGLMGESLYETLENRYGIILKNAVETVEARTAKQKEANLLNIKRGSAVLHATRVTYDINDKPIEVVITISRADKYSYTINLTGRQKR